MDIDPVPASVIDAAKRAFTEREEVPPMKFTVELIVEAEDLAQASVYAESAADFLNAVEDFSPEPGDEVVTVGVVALYEPPPAGIGEATARYMAEDTKPQ